jgi:hypothetical protein
MKLKIKKKAETGNSLKRIQFKSADIELDQLLLDPNNYRFLDNPAYKAKIKTKFHVPAVQETTLRLLEQDKRYQLDELKKSMLTNGFVPMERIIVVPYKYKAGKFVVVEGNRRVAALKVLMQEAKECVRELSEAEKKSFSKIPCAILQATENGLKHAERVIMGIRHIAGPKEWGAYQQAQLISELHDAEAQDFGSIGEHLGISPVEAARRYRAMRALKTMEEDELYGENSSTQFYRLFHELVSLPDARKRFGWDDDTDRFVNKEKAREFFDLIAPQNGTEAKLKTYSDVRKLKLIVGRPKAEAALLDPDRGLADALKLADTEIEQEAASGLGVGEQCREMRVQVENIKVTELGNLTKADLKAIEQLLEALQALKKTVEKQVSDASNESSAATK